MHGASLTSQQARPLNKVFNWWDYPFLNTIFWVLGKLRFSLVWLSFIHLTMRTGVNSYIAFPFFDTKKKHISIRAQGAFEMSEIEVKGDISFSITLCTFLHNLDLAWNLVNNFIYSISENYFGQRGTQETNRPREVKCQMLFIKHNLFII